METFLFLFQKSTTWSWEFILKDKHDKTTLLQISCPICLVLNALYIIATNKAHSSAMHIFINSHNSRLNISLGLNMSLSYSEILVFGLQTINSDTGQYDVAVCSGSTYIKSK